MVFCILYKFDSPLVLLFQFVNTKYFWSLKCFSSTAIWVSILYKLRKRTGCFEMKKSEMYCLDGLNVLIFVIELVLVKSVV